MAGLGENLQPRRLADAGCTVIQIEEPAIDALAAADPDHPDLQFMIEAFNYEVDGVDDDEVGARHVLGQPDDAARLRRPSRCVRWLRSS